jgi:hypothetical protein
VKTYRPHLQGSKQNSRTERPLKMGASGGPETSVTLYQPRPRKIPEGWIFELRSGGSSIPRKRDIRRFTVEFWSGNDGLLLSYS